jgi:hypothetical protein
MKVTTWAIVALVLASGALIAMRPAQGCPEAQAVVHVPSPPKAPAPPVAPAAPAGHGSFIIAARMGWL